VSTVPPIRREILVDAGPQTAFDVFTGGIGRWWPLAEHSVHGAGGTVAFTSGQLVERSASRRGAAGLRRRRARVGAGRVSAGPRSRSDYRGMTTDGPPG
jgi:hypothetical protein